MATDTNIGGGPRDVAVMESILREMGVEQYDQNVPHQMLEFSYRYIVSVLEDAKIYSEHSNKKELDESDIRLAIHNRMDHSFTSPPPRDFLLEVAREKNSKPLPLIPEKFGPRLPPDRYCLTGSNYKIKSKKKESLTSPQLTLSATFRHPVKSNNNTRPLTSPLIQAVTTPTTTKSLTQSLSTSSSNMPRLQ